MRAFELQLERLGPTFRRLCAPRTLVPILAIEAAGVCLAILLFGPGLEAVPPAAASCTAPSTTSLKAGIGLAFAFRFQRRLMGILVERTAHAPV